MDVVMLSRMLTVCVLYFDLISFVVVVVVVVVVRL